MSREGDVPLGIEALLEPRHVRAICNMVSIAARRYPEAMLGDTFEARMVSGVLRFLLRLYAKGKTSKADLRSPKLWRSLVGQAVRDNATKEIARNLRRLRVGIHHEPIAQADTLEAVVEAAARVDETKAAERKLAEMLRLGVAPERLLAFVWMELMDEKSPQTSKKVRRLLGRYVSPDTLRQYRVRHFGKIRAIWHSGKHCGSPNEGDE